VTVSSVKRLSCLPLLALVASCGARTGDLLGSPPLPDARTTARADAGPPRDATTRSDADEASAHRDANEAAVSQDAGEDARRDARAPPLDALPDRPSPPPTVAPRPIAPLSTSRVTRNRPTLRWELPAGVDDATLDLCLDRACASPFGAPVHLIGSSYTPPSPLPMGVVYWRLHPSTVTALVSPTWEFTVGAANAPVDASWGTTLDVNGDGYADVAVGGTNEAAGTGSVDVYLGSASGTPTTPSIRLTEPYPIGGEFGVAVASAGDVDGDGYGDLVAFIGAGVYVYLGGPPGIVAAPQVLSAPGPVGVAVASAGDVNGDGYGDVVVGGWANGEAYIYLGSATGLAATAFVTLTTPLTGAGYGSAVATAGDVNGDGYADVVVGVQGSGEPGECFVYLGAEGGPSSTPSFTLDLAPGADSTFGASVATAGDVNGDGYADVIVGAWGAMRAYLYLGEASGLATAPVNVLSDPGAADATFGFVASAGDVNGDGFADVIVGGQVFLGSATGLATTFATLTDPTGASPTFSTAVSSAGDVNGDGFSDVIVGDYGAYDAATNTQGAAWVYFGNPMGIDTVVGAALANPMSSLFGISVCGATN